MQTIKTDKNIRKSDDGLHFMNNKKSNILVFSDFVNYINSKTYGLFEFAVPRISFFLMHKYVKGLRNIFVNHLYRIFIFYLP